VYIYIVGKILEDPISSFYVKLLTDRQTNTQMPGITLAYLPGGGVFVQVKVMADDVAQQRRCRGAPWRARGHCGWRGQQRRDRFQGLRRRRIDDGAEDDVLQTAEPVAPPRQVPRRRVYIRAAALDRLSRLQPEELLLQITNRVSVV